MTKGMKRQEVTATKEGECSHGPMGEEEVHSVGTKQWATESCVWGLSITGVSFQ